MNDARLLTRGIDAILSVRTLTLILHQRAVFARDDYFRRNEIESVEKKSKMRIKEESGKKKEIYRSASGEKLHRVYRFS